MSPKVYDKTALKVSSKPKFLKKLLLPLLGVSGFPRLGIVSSQGLTIRAIPRVEKVLAIPINPSQELSEHRRVISHIL